MKKIVTGGRLVDGDKTRVAIVNAIREFIDEHGYSPSIRDLCRLTGIKSTSNVSYHLEVLEKGGVVRREPGTMRSVRLVGDDV